MCYFPPDISIPPADRKGITGEPIPPDRLKTYAEALAQYHLSREDKFENGQFLDRGRTERRHVIETGFKLIGKEANRVGESGEAYGFIFPFLRPPLLRFPRMHLSSIS